ncbi:hypothetical protein BDY21DRAFT_338013 [Lineolata rhizophorae]|uniref:Conidiation-specific protein 10 n=1 Tax=Lineolata rhizophorae TaxID=578093 RepID=A0A6A6P651_9PEZI|nr:hypothetical protein BDY21DRAFT_338013 [Lineolata rhizophorae]
MSDNPGSFANRPTEEVEEIAAQGGHASKLYANHVDPKGTYNPGNFANRPTEEVREAAAKGGAHSHGPTKSGEDVMMQGRNPDGTFQAGSEAAKAAGEIGGSK